MGSYVGRLKAAPLSPDLKPCECELGALDKGSLSTGLQPLSAQPILCIGFGPTANPDRGRQVERALCRCLLDYQNPGQPWRLSAIWNLFPHIASVYFTFCRPESRLNENVFHSRRKDRVPSRIRIDLHFNS